MENVSQHELIGIAFTLWDNRM